MPIGFSKPVRGRRPLPVGSTGIAALAGYFSNGATNPKWAAALARVRGGTGRGKIVWKGDSVTVGQGGGSNADSFGLTGARVNRVPARVAARLSSQGTPSIDCGVVGDQAINSATGQTLLSAYDPQVALNSWGVVRDMTFAGGAFLRPDASALTFAPSIAVDTFEIITYESGATIFTSTIDNAAPATGGSSFTSTSVGGFRRTVLTASSVGLHTLRVTGNNAVAALRSLRAWSSQTPAIDMIVHAALGAKADDQASSGGNSWQNQEALGFDAPDLTIINVGLNDMSNGTATSAVSASVGSMIDKAKVSGDVLVLFPHPAGSPYNNGVAAMRDAVAAIAASKGVSFFSLYDYYGPFTTAFGNRLFDGLVHPKAELYDEEAGLILQALMRMAAGT